MKPIQLFIGIVLLVCTQSLAPAAASSAAMHDSAGEVIGSAEGAASVSTPSHVPAGSALAGAVGDELLVAYPVPGNPYAVSVEAPGRVWFTLPQQNLIGRLEVTSTVDFGVVTYTVPTTNSSPYDLVYAGGAVWFTEQQGNKVGRLDPSTGTFTEFPVPTPLSTPSGIDVLVGMPTHVWFTERNGVRLGHLVYTNTVSSAMLEHPLPGLPVECVGSSPQLEDVSIQSATRVWFTAPGTGCIGRYDPTSYQPFWWRALGDGGEPWSVQVAAGGSLVWFTDRAGHRIGALIWTTISNLQWYSLPLGGGAPNGLAWMGGKVWFTEALGQRVSSLNPLNGGVRSYGVTSGHLGGIDADADGQLWFAEHTSMAIGQWRPPYFRFTYLPIILRGYSSGPS